jgi:hypothetical protein
MPYEDEHPSLRISVRDVAAAWICCGLVALGALLAESGSPRVDTPIASYAGVHIPSRNGWNAHDIYPGSSLDDPADGSLITDANGEDSSFCSTLDVAEDATLPTEASRFTSAASRC